MPRTWISHDFDWYPLGLTILKALYTSDPLLRTFPSSGIYSQSCIWSGRGLFPNQRQSRMHQVCHSFFQYFPPENDKQKKNLWKRRRFEIKNEMQAAYERENSESKLWKTNNGTEKGKWDTASVSSICENEQTNQRSMEREYRSDLTTALFFYSILFLLFFLL